MSVNNQTFHQLASQFLCFKHAIHTDIRHYRAYLAQIQSQFMQSLTSLNHPSKIKSDQQPHSEPELREQIKRLLLEHEQLKKQLISSRNSCNELEAVNNVLKRQNNEKEERVRSLVQEVQQIKIYMKQLQNLNKNDEVVDFDDEVIEEIGKRNDGLETIKEVSQYDFSVTMSMKSFNSELQEESFSLQNQRVFSLKSSQDFFENNSAQKAQENFQIQNYQDALEILKNYNNGLGMIRKDRNNLYDVQTKENIPNLGPNSPNYAENKEKKVKNGTMAKIRKMKKIQNLDLDNCDGKKQQKKPFTVIDQNSTNYEDSNFKESRLISQDESRKQAIKSGGRGSISSTRIKSRICQEVVSLQMQMRHLLQILNEVNSSLQKPITISKLKDGISTISYGAGYEYKGNCDIQEKPNGFGKLLWKGEVIYQGEWRGGKLHGWGKLVLLPFYKKQSKFIVSVDGNFRFGMVEGTVVCLFNSGQKFMGAIKKGKIEEQGTFVSEKGIMTGHWQNNTLVFLI